jgi:hypothetical protein
MDRKIAINLRTDGASLSRFIFFAMGYRILIKKDFAKYTLTLRNGQIAGTQKRSLDIRISQLIVTKRG